MNKILMKTMNRNYYKQGQSSKVPYILILIILALLYIMNGMNEDRKDADTMFKKAIEEFPKNDTIILKQKKEIDSLVGVIEWYRRQEVERKSKSFKYTKRIVETPKLEEDSL